MADDTISLIFYLIQAELNSAFLYTFIKFWSSFIFGPSTIDTDLFQFLSRENFDLIHRFSACVSMYNLRI